jgi:hypothetical protein
MLTGKSNSCPLEAMEPIARLGASTPEPDVVTYPLLVYTETNETIGEKHGTR